MVKYLAVQYCIKVLGTDFSKIRSLPKETVMPVAFLILRTLDLVP